MSLERDLELSIRLNRLAKTGQFTMGNNRIYRRGEVDYWGLEGVRQSQLKALAKSPRHYQYWLTHQQPDKAAWEMGRALHTAVLEPERFLLDYKLWESRTSEDKVRQRRGKAWDQFCADNAGKSILRDSDYEEATEAMRAVREDHVAMAYLGTGRPEVTCQWTDDITGLVCKTRIDWVQDHGEHVIVELKTARDAGDGFARAVANFRYHWQFAWHQDGYEACTGVRPKVVVIAVETAQPRDVVTWVVEQDTLEIGRDEYRQQLERLKECQDQGRWPGQSQGVERFLALPAWAVPDDDDDVSDMGFIV